MFVANESRNRYLSLREAGQVCATTGAQLRSTRKRRSSGHTTLLGSTGLYRLFDSFHKRVSVRLKSKRQRQFRIPGQGAVVEVEAEVGTTTGAEDAGKVALRVHDGLAAGGLESSGSESGIWGGRSEADGRAVAVALRVHEVLDTGGGSEPSGSESGFWVGTADAVAFRVHDVLDTEGTGFGLLGLGSLEGRTTNELDGGRLTGAEEVVGGELEPSSPPPLQLVLLLPLPPPLPPPGPLLCCGT